ncbi:MAG: PPC domain-containing protein [Phycisphaerae bacterium]|nr:PPC domain-containing protein [Phycisphaerae bacterium]
MSGRSLGIVAAGLLALSLTRSLWAGSPEVRSILPTGAQRGTTVTFTLSGERLSGAQALLVYQGSGDTAEGITVSRVANTDERTVVADCVIAPDCRLGEHPLRLRTASGISDLGTIWVGALPVVAEVEPNGELSSAQRVPFGSTVSGVITREDADWFAFEAKAGDRLSAEIEGMRLGRGNFDPAIAILDARRFELAECDDSPLLRQDAVASAIAPRDGTYYVSVRDAAYGGSDASHYRLHIGSFPRPRMLWPPAIAPGSTGEVRFIGEAKELAPMSVVAAASGRRQGIFATDAGGVAPSPNDLLLSTLPLAPEPADPAAVPSAPIAFQGVIAEPGATNRHRVRCKAGEVLHVALYARRLRSPLDAVLEVAREDGSIVGTLDDVVGADPEIQGPVDKDGIYELRVRDHRHRGGEAFVYRLEIAPPMPSLRVSLERVDNRRPQFLQAIAVPRGGRMAAMLRTERTSIAGEIAFDWPLLPAGLSVRSLPQAADLPNAPLLFTAAADAPLDGGLVDVIATGGASDAPVRGGFAQTMPLVIGPPNETVYYETTVERLAVAVTEAPPFRVTLVPPASPLLRIGAKNLAVRVERDAGFTGDVTLHMLWNPPGVTSANAITVPGNQSEALYPINAGGDAPVRTWPVALLAHSPVQGGDVWISSDLVDLAVAEPFEQGAIQLAATERGKPASLLCTLQSVRPFEGKATLTLMGLPAHASSTPREITSADREVVFDITTKDETPLGQHRGLFCELSLPVGGEIVTHRLAFDGVLRVDAPPAIAAAPPAAAPPPPPTAEPAPAPPRPLSRLEQLRKDAAERGR